MKNTDHGLPRSHPATPTQDRPCFLCGCSDSEPFVALGEFGVVKCRGCGLGTTCPFPTEEQSARLSGSIYTLEERLRVYESKRSTLRRRYEKQLDEIGSLLGGRTGRLLDIGCSLGEFLNVARSRGHHVFGVETSVETAMYSRDHLGLDVFCGCLEDAGYEDGSFDVVTLWDVLEHVPDPRALLREVRRVLAEDGVLVVQSPNMDSMMAEWCGERWDWWTAPDHLYHFTPPTMARLLSELFRVEAVRTWEPLADLAANMARSAFRIDGSSGGGRRLVLRGLSAVTARMAMPFILPFQRLAWTRQRGALVTVYARNS